MRNPVLFVPILVLAGCAQIATVKETAPPLPAAGDQTQELQKAARLEKGDPLHALGSYLESADVAFDRLKGNPDDKQARSLYNFAVARSIEVIEEGRLNPWDGALKVPSAAGEYTLTNVRHGGPEYAPGNYELIPGDTITLGGTYLDRRVTVDGIGATAVAVSREERQDFAKTFATRRVYANVTALIRFKDHRAEVE